MITYILIGTCLTIIPILYFYYQPLMMWLKIKLKQILLEIMVAVGVKWLAQQRPVSIQNRTLKIPYTYYGAKFTIYVPYNRSMRRKMLNTKMSLIRGEEEVDITQMPGCSYLVTAGMLGGDEIRVIDLDTSEIKVYGKDEIPQL